MTVVEELMAQRDAILFGEHVRRVPLHPNEVCAVARMSHGYSMETLGTEAETFLNEVTVGRWGRNAFVVNDNMPHVTTADILDAFDEAIRNAKGQEDATA